MFNLIKSIIKPSNFRSIITAPSTISNSKLLESQQPIQYEPSPHSPVARQCWIESLDTEDENFVGLIDLHPKVFASTPRIDLIHLNTTWQRNYRHVSFAQAKTRAEVRGGGRKPWPQKGGGRARHGSIRSPIFRGGGVAHGPRSPTVHFYMLPFFQRVMGLTSTLSVKLAQDDLHVVRDLELPTDDREYIKSLVEKRNWGPSVLFVDDNDMMSENIAIATDNINYINLMPVYGLNVYSMLKHDTLVLTESAVNKITERILFQFNRIDADRVAGKFRLNQNN